MSIDTGLGLTFKENYPIAGINQSSQQFRDNFTVLREVIENLHSAKNVNASLFSFNFGISEQDGTVTVDVDFARPAGGKPVRPGTLRYAANALQVWNGSDYASLVATSANSSITAATSAATANTIVVRDANANVAVNALRANAVNAASVTGTILSGADVIATRVETASVQASLGAIGHRFTADAEYGRGTVVVYGANATVTVSNTVADHRVAGVVVDTAAVSLNSTPADVENALRPLVASIGPALCKVIGPVSPGDLLVTSNTVGVAMVGNGSVRGSVIGKALEEHLFANVALIDVALHMF